MSGASIWCFRIGWYVEVHIFVTFPLSFENIYNSVIKRTMRLRNNCFVSLFILFDDIKVEQYTKNDDEDESKMKYLVYKQKLKPFRIFFIIQ